MANKMLIDATHPEETRVVVVRESRVEEFDYESASKKQLRGNIYLAKVTRVEPSLQAAFVNYGGNRHGFLPFNEIHPDYYHLPLAERQALKQEEQRASRAAQNRHHREDRKGRGNGGQGKPGVVEGLPEGREVEPGDDAEVDAAGTHATSAAGSAGNDGARDNGAHDNGGQDNGGEVGTAEAAIALEAALPATRYSGDLYAPTDSAAEEEEDDSAEDDDDEVYEAVETGGESGFNKDESGEDDDEDDVVEVINDDGEGRPAPERKASAEERAEAGTVESIGSEDALEELPDRIRRRRRNYKIQEVIKRGQILLVQVVKEERGNKGAALTTYLSLAGRYTVLMPNTGSGGGISRKISSPGDRKRLREIAGELDVQEGMGLIIRTAGASRTKSEIKRDYEYLLRLWENVRELTLKSSAPCLVYEEGDLIKRSIRDLYNRDIDEIQVAGEDAYKDAKDFMRMLMPSHAKNVQFYRDPEPIFIRHEVERQLNAMFSPQVTLPSGGYIVLNQTEALVAIDVNSGKSTREFSIEETALKTNLEASEEIARQLRLRDLAGLIVVDFIDMEEKRNNRAVERKLKECLRNDRARIQVGRISHFGLLEMSRQRLRTGMIEGSTCACPTCQGTGFVRSTESVALSVLRGLEDWLRTNNPCNLNAVTGTEVALYILNHKRGYLRDIEQRYGVTLSISANDRVHGGSFLLEKLSPAVAPPPANNVSMAVRQSDWADEPTAEDEEEDVQANGGPESEGEGDGDGRRSRRRRRRRRGGRGEGAETNAAANGVAPPWEAREDAVAEDDGEEDEASAEGEERDASRAEGDDAGGRRRSRRRGRRGGRHQRARHGREDGTFGEAGEAPEAGVPAADGPAPADLAANAEEIEAAPPVVTESAASEPAPWEAAAAETSSAQPTQAETAETGTAVAEPAQAERAQAERAQAEPAQAEPARAEAVEQQPASQPEPAAEPREPEAAAKATEAKAPRGYANGNGAAHAHSAGAEPAAEAQVEHAEAEPAAVEPATIAEPKPRGPRRGWWQRRGPE